MIAFSDFTYPEVATTFGLVERTVPSLFANVPTAALTPALITTLRRNARLALAINTEKAQAE